MTRVKTPILGISTTSTYEEGTTYSLVNLRPKNGALHPVAPRKVMQELSQKYDIVFVHQNNDYKNWIGVINEENRSSVYCDILSDNPRNIVGYPGIQEKINSVEQIGNTLSLITDSNIYYLLFQNGDYIFLGEIPDLPVVGFKTSDEMSRAKMYFTNVYESGTIKPDNFIDATKGLVNKAMDALINGFNDKDGTFHKGQGLQLFDACFIRYAFRLYDGTLTKHSSPILIMPIRPIVGKEEEGFTDSIKSISYDFDDTLRNESYVEVHGYRVAMTYDLTSLGGDNIDRWKDIIKSVDVFMSQPLGLSSIENIRSDMPTTGSPRLLQYNLIKGMPPEALKNVENTSNFYFVRSLELGSSFWGIGSEYEEAYDFLPSSDLDFSKMENLIYQERMSDDQFSHHKQGASVSFAYNNRLHLANIKTTFFRGFRPNAFIWHNTVEEFIKKDENGEPIRDEEGKLIYEENREGNYNGYLYKDVDKTSYKSLVFEFELSVGSTLEKVYSAYSGIYFGNEYPVFMSAFISYPDPRAQRMSLYGIDHEGNWFRLFTKHLYKHNLLNIAYCVTEGLVPIVSEKDPLLISNKIDTSKEISITENKIKVSELNNPLVFPVENTYQAGNGMILAMSTNAIRISEGQFGQFPLYVFTTQGIYSLDVGQGEVVYSGKSAPTSYEIPTTSIVASTPFGVVFTSARGICIIRGQEVDLLTPQLHEAPRKLNLEYAPVMKDIIHDFNQKAFADYLQGIDIITYDPYENELIFCDKESEFNYVLNLYSQSFYQSTEKIDLIVQNTFPELYAIGDNLLKYYKEGDIDQNGNPQRVNVSFITRPLQFGEPYIKWLEKFQILCTLYDTHPLVFGSQSSNSGVNFYSGVWRSANQRGDYTTLETSTIPGNKFRDFLFYFGGTVGVDSVINLVISKVSKQYNPRIMK